MIQKHDQLKFNIQFCANLENLAKLEWDMQKKNHSFNQKFLQTSLQIHNNLGGIIGVF